MSIEEKKDEFVYKFVIAMAPPDNQGVVEMYYILDESQYNEVRTKIRQGKSKISFIQYETGEPICFNVGYPVVYATVRKEIKPKHIINPFEVIKKN